jgi:beta-mannosidase
MWIASNEIRERQVNLEVKFISIKTGEVVAGAVKQKVAVTPNGTTEVINAKVDVQMQELAHEEVDEEDASTFVVNQAGYFKYPTRHKKGVAPFDLSKHDPFVIYAKILDAETGELLSTDTAWPDPLKYLTWEDRGVELKVADGGREVVLKAERPVKGFVFQEERGGGTLSDNGFDIMPGEEKTVRFAKEVGDGKGLRWTYLGAASGEERL